MKVQNKRIDSINIAKTDELRRDIATAVGQPAHLGGPLGPAHKRLFDALLLLLGIGRNKKRKGARNVLEIALKFSHQLQVIEVQLHGESRRHDGEYGIGKRQRENGLCGTSDGRRWRRDACLLACVPGPELFALTGRGKGRSTCLLLLKLLPSCIGAASPKDGTVADEKIVLHA